MTNPQAQVRETWNGGAFWTPGEACSRCGKELRDTDLITNREMREMSSEEMMDIEPTAIRLTDGSLLVVHHGCITNEETQRALLAFDRQAGPMSTVVWED